MKDKIILFGGSFDPVHKGHIEILRYVQDKIGAAKSILIPTKQSPFKNNSPIATNLQRLEMLKLAIKGCKEFEVSDVEFHLPAPSYSYHTVYHFHKIFGSETKLYWLCGADNIEDLPKWYKISDLLKLCEMLIVCRGGYPAPDISRLNGKFDDATLDMLRGNMLQTPEIDVSSTQIRENIKNALPTANLLDAAVEKYLRCNKVYASAEG